MKSCWKWGAPGVLALVAVALTSGVRAEEEHGALAELKMASCVILPTRGNTVRGTLVFRQTKDGVRLTGQVRNLTPGEHGFHIHEFGDLRDREGKGAGGHYNPEGTKHGGPESKERHAGDLGNITANDDGVAKVDITVHDLKLHFIVGRSIVVHGGKDDLSSQPSGAAGPRVGLGIIGIAAPPEKKE